MNIKDDCTQQIDKASSEIVQIDKDIVELVKKKDELYAAIKKWIEIVDTKRRLPEEA